MVSFRFGLRKQLIGALSILGMGVMAPQASADPLVVVTNNDASVLANTLLAASSGITLNSSTYTGAATASGTFTGGTGIIGFESGILLTSGSAGVVVGPNNAGGAGSSNGGGGTALIAGSIDTALLEIDFTPNGSSVEFSYVFGSEEYNEFVNTGFNDAFKFFVNGTNYALIPSTSTPVEINTVNNGSNSAFFIDNTGGALNTQLDGLTVVLSFVAPVNSGLSNLMQLVIADRGDSILDSAVFIAGGSLQVCGEPGQPPCGGGGSVPEPVSMVLVGLGLAGLAARRKVLGRG